MLLKHLYDFAVSRDLLDDPAFRRNTPVRWIIHLDRTGKLIGQGPQETIGPRENKGHEYDVPKTTRPTGGGQVADFLVDDIGAIFRLNSKLDKKPIPRAITNLKAKHDDYWRQIRAARDATGDLRFDALLAFHVSLAGAAPPFLRPDAKATGWIITSSSGEQTKLGTDMLTFAVDQTLFHDDSIRDYWRSIYAREVVATEAVAKRGTCLITGESNVPLARTHTPMVTGLPKPAKGSGAGIVGADKAAFWSYGLQKADGSVAEDSSAHEDDGEDEQDDKKGKNPGYLAPSSIRASRGYLLALQHLSRNQNHWLSLGPTWLCFWAVESKEATDIFARLFRQPDPMTVRKFFTSPWAGLEKQPPVSDKFIAATLTAAATLPATSPRIVIKAWVQMPLATAAENFKAWFADLQIDTGSGVSTAEPTTEIEAFPPLAVKRLAGCTAPLTKKGNRLVPDEEKQCPDVIAQLYRAALEGAAPSVSLVKPILDQLQSRLVRDKNYKKFELPYDESRFALLKLILNRNRKNTTMEIKTELTTDTDDPAYNCGRLLAVLAATQDKAFEYNLEGAGVAERYFGTASVSPASVLPLLLRLNRHHLHKISKSERFGGHERFIEDQIQDVCALFKPTKPGLPPMFPRTLDLQAQGRFALGFYQQMASDHAARQPKPKAGTSNPESETK